MYWKFSWEWFLSADDTKQSHEAVVISPGSFRTILVVYDGQPGPAYDEVFRYGIRFSDDGRYWFYWARKGKLWFAVVNGQPGPAYDRIIKPYWDSQTHGTFEYLAIKGDTLCRVRPIQDNRPR